METLETIRELLSKRIREIRKALDINQVEAADTCDVSLRSYQRAEDPREGIEFDTFTKIAKGLGVEPYQMLMEPGQVAVPTPLEAMAIVAKALLAKEKPPEPAPKPKDSGLFPVPHGVDANDFARLVSALTRRPGLMVVFKNALAGFALADKPQRGDSDT